MGLAKLIYDLIGTPVPQFLKRDGLAFEAIKGANGAMDVNLKDAAGGVNALAVNSDGSINTKINGSLANIKIATIPINENSSNVIDLNGETLEAIIIPNEWTSSNITFAVSHDGVDFRPMYYQDLEHTVAVVANSYITLDPVPFHSVSYIKIRSGSSGAGVSQFAARELILLTKPV